MKIIKEKEKVVPQQVIEVPNGEYCEREDGSVKCKYLQYDISPFRGAYWYCDQFGCEFRVPYDNKPVSANRDIKKCNECKACEVKD